MRMNKEQLTNHTKFTALNKIRKICDENYKGYSDYPNDGSYAEQRAYMVDEIIENLEKDLEKIKFKYKGN